MPSQGYDNNDWIHMHKKTKDCCGHGFKIKIEFINFAFDNPEIIKAMRKRGDAIKVADFKAVEKIQKKI